MQNHLSDFDFIPLELPGRGKRTKEELITCFDDAANDIHDQIAHRIGSSGFLLYGHSMGSLLTLKITAFLEHRNIFPLQIIVSGNPGPGVYEDKKRYLLTRDAMKAELREFGGVMDEVLTSDDLFDYYEPILRADFKIAEKIDTVPFLPVQAPIYAMMGSEEQYSDLIGNWKNYTRSSFEYRIMEGKHFFIHHHAAEISRIIRECYLRRAKSTTYGQSNGLSQA